MKCKVRLTHTVELVVEGKSEDEIMDWLSSTTTIGAVLLAEQYSKSPIDEYYNEEILKYVTEDEKVDYVIREE